MIMNLDTKRVPYGLPVHDHEEENAVLEIIRNHKTIMGEKVKQFEQEIATLFSKDQGIMVNSGSSANLLTFEVLDIPENSEVITPILTFATTLSPIIKKGLIPVFVDVEPETYVVDIDQVLPPFDDGEFMVNRDVDPATFMLAFEDRDSHDSRYAEIKPSGSWSEADDRVITGLSAIPVNAAGGWDPAATTDPVAEAYIMSATLASWGNYLTWYAFNIGAEAKVKAADVKNPLTDLNADGTIDATDMVIYMHYDNLASGGGKTSFGMPYALLVDSSNPAAPAAVDDSAGDFALALSLIHI